MNSDNLNFMPITIRAEIRRVVFETSDSSYAVLRLLDENEREFTAVGPIVSPVEGQTIEVTGNWEKHSEYGRQLRVTSYRYTLPATKEGLIRFLSSGAVNGVGKTLATAIVNYFGERTLTVLNNSPSELLHVPKIGKKKAKAIADSWKESASKREAFIFLQGLGITTAYCNRLFKKYGEDAVNVVKQNPYRLAEEVDGIGFKKADEIALEMGIPPTALERLTAAAVYCINQTINSGHVGYPENLLLDEMVKLIELDTELLRNGIAHALKRKLLISRDGLLYAPMLAFAESELPKHIKRLASAEKFAGEKTKYAKTIKENITFCDAQISAVERIAQQPLTIITGGPGVGKTTVVREIVRRAVDVGLKVALAAPTGRAAKRLAESTGMAAKTIHRLLQYDGASGKFIHNETTPLKYDLIVIDEVSMLDLLLSLALFRAIRSGSSVVLVGDSDQLPSVGAGTVLADFISSEKYFLTTQLTQIFRQGQDSEIITNSHLVNRGQRLKLKAKKDNELGDFYWIQQDDMTKIQSILERLILDRIPDCFHFDIERDIQVLTPMNRGNGGALALNEFLQKILNGKEVIQFQYGEKIFKLNDKVIQNSNNYDKNVFNGDLGRITYINPQLKKFYVTFDDGVRVEYNFDEADQLTMAYAITIHKSQGSEFKVVIMLLLPQHFVMLKRNLIYTGMTRAKKLLILIGSEQSVNLAIRNFQTEKRYSNLVNYLK